VASSLARRNYNVTHGRSEMSNTFNFFPLAPFPSPSESFPVGVQFQIDATNLGSPNPTNVNFSGLSITGTYDELTDTVNFEVSAGGSGGGGGGSPGGLNTEIQYNDSGSFGGDAQLTWTKASNTLKIGSLAQPGATIKSNDNALVSGSAGAISITAGAASNDGGIGGDVTVKAGNQTFTGTVTLSPSPGNASFEGGDSHSNTAGAASLKGGVGFNTFNGGDALVHGGDGDGGGGGATVSAGFGQNGNGGNTAIYGGASDHNAGGNVTITGGDGLSGGTTSIYGGNAGPQLILQGSTATVPGSVEIFSGGAPGGSNANGGDILIKGGTKDGAGTSIGYLNITLLNAVPTAAPTDWSGSGFAPLALVNTGSVYKLAAYLNGAWRSVALT
jgi:hypothetical protein